MNQHEDMPVKTEAIEVTAMGGGRRMFLLSGVAEPMYMVCGFNDDSDIFLCRSERSDNLWFMRARGALGRCMGDADVVLCALYRLRLKGFKVRPSTFAAIRAEVSNGAT